MSDRIDQISEVVKELEILINNSFKNEDEDFFLPKEDVKEFLSKAFKNVSYRHHIEESTVKDKCTRQIDCDMNTFFSEVIDHITGGSKLSNRVKNHKCTGDTDKAIDAKLG